ncbi:MAG: FUSC family protein, partial [Pseudomonadota bacterium]|nr:FUSC family protein [Pseudomonadota bacterium]
MSKSQLLLTIVLGVVCLGIIGFCIWSVVRGGPTELILGAAVVTLGLAQLISFTARDSTTSTALKRVSEVMAAHTALARELHSVSQRLEALESGDVPRLANHQRPDWQQPAIAPRPQQRPVGNGAAAHALKAPAPDRLITPPITNGSGRYEHPPPSPGGLEDERFDLYLEPIVQIEDGST